MCVNVLHSNGLGRSSTFCAIYTTLERFKAEQCVDIFQVVKSLRINRPGAVDSLVRFEINYICCTYVLKTHTFGLRNLLVIIMVRLKIKWGSSYKM